MYVAVVTITPDRVSGLRTTSRHDADSKDLQLATNATADFSAAAAAPRVLHPAHSESAVDGFARRFYTRVASPG